MGSQPIKPRLRITFIIIAAAGLILTLMPSFLNWQGVIGPEKVNNLMVAGTILWFGSAIFIFVKKDPD